MVVRLVKRFAAELPQGKTPVVIISSELAIRKPKASYWTDPYAIGTKVFVYVRIAKHRLTWTAAQVKDQVVGQWVSVETDKPMLYPADDKRRLIHISNPKHIRI